MSGKRVRFGAFEFDPASGELSRRDAAGGPEVQRLPRQPALLLALLVEKAGGVASREEIRERIWPEVSVDFESGLHFCVRQVRSALGESASESQYIETLPRRGYRLVPKVEEIGPPARRFWPIGAAALGGALLLLLLLLWSGARPADEEAPVRIAIMPFLPPPEWPEPVPPIAEWILVELDGLAGRRAEIVGPTTTTGYTTNEPDSLARLASDYDVPFIVNGRFLLGEGRPRLLAELIRTSDGAHVWVRGYEQLDSGQRIGTEIGRSVAQKLALDREPQGK